MLAFDIFKRCELKNIRERLQKELESNRVVYRQLLSRRTPNWWRTWQWFLLGTSVNTPFKVLTKEFEHSGHGLGLQGLDLVYSCTKWYFGTWSISVWTEHFFAPVPRHQCSANKCERISAVSRAGNLIERAAERYSFARKFAQNVC